MQTMVWPTRWERYGFDARELWRLRRELVGGKNPADPQTEESAEYKTEGAIRCPNGPADQIALRPQLPLGPPRVFVPASFLPFFNAFFAI